MDATEVASLDAAEDTSLAVGRPCAAEVDASMKPSREKVGAVEEGVPAAGGLSERRGLRSPHGRPVATELSGVESIESVPAGVGCGPPRRTRQRHSSAPTHREKHHPPPRASVSWKIGVLITATTN